MSKYLQILFLFLSPFFIRPHHLYLRRYEFILKSAYYFPLIAASLILWMYSNVESELVARYLKFFNLGVGSLVMVSEILNYGKFILMTFFVIAIYFLVAANYLYKRLSCEFMDGTFSVSFKFFILRWTASACWLTLLAWLMIKIWIYGIERFFEVMDKHDNLFIVVIMAFYFFNNLKIENDKKIEIEIFGCEKIAFRDSLLVVGVLLLALLFVSIYIKYLATNVS